jgi:cation/acetate symporter
MFRRAVDVHPGALSIMGPGKLLKDPLNALSLGIALMFGRDIHFGAQIDF